MNECPGQRTQPGSQAGFALLVMLALVGIGSVGVLLAVQTFLPPLSDVNARVEANLGVVESAAREAFERSGAFPADLAALATASGLPTDGGWRNDPWGAAQDLDYRLMASGLRIRSRGVDRRLGTADDVQFDVPAEGLVRVRQRARLRLLRALLLRSPFRSAGTMSVGEQASMRTAMHDYAAARREWLTADTAARALLTTRMAAATVTINALVAAHACPALPVALTGAGGLMEQLAVPDTCGVDGLGRALLANAALGVIAAGNDRVGGTNDDM